MRVTWDPAKSIANVNKHGISFVDAATVLDDPLALTIADDRHDERRFVTLGCDLAGRLLVIVYAHNASGDIRLISSRRATRRERKAYENEES